MQKTDTHKFPNESDEIVLKELFDILTAGKWLIISITSFITIIGIIYSLLLPDIYESKAILTPIDSSSGISGSLDRYSGLAGLAGISLPSSGAESNSIKALKTLDSLSFFEDNIMPNIFLPNLMALKSWEHKTDSLNYHKDIYNKDKNVWVRDFSYPYKQIPSAQESYQIFKNNHLSISESKKTGFVSLSIKHQSPILAKKWAELMITEVNNFYREKDKLESQKAVEYLNEQIIMTNLSEVKQVIAQLLQQETQKLTLIEANEYYVFDYIDPPAVMEEKSEPKRIFICILSILFGFILGILIVFIKHFSHKKTYKDKT